MEEEDDTVGAGIEAEQSLPHGTVPGAQGWVADGRGVHPCQVHGGPVRQEPGLLLPRCRRVWSLGCFYSRTLDGVVAASCPLVWVAACHRGPGLGLKGIEAHYLLAEAAPSLSWSLDLALSSPISLLSLMSPPRPAAQCCPSPPTRPLDSPQPTQAEGCCQSDMDSEVSNKAVASHLGWLAGLLLGAVLRAGALQGDTREPNLEHHLHLQQGAQISLPAE